MLFKIGRIPENKIFNTEKEKYLIDNYKTTSKKELGKHIGVTKSSIERKMIELGLVRTKEERSMIIKNAKDKIDHKKLAIKRLKIEGGGRNCSNKIKYHKDKWIKLNGPIVNGMILVYENEDYNNFNDLILIKNRSYNPFLKKRGIKLRKELKEKNNLANYTRIDQKKREKDRLEKKQEELFKNYKQKTVTEVSKELLNSGNVKIRLDHKTVIYAKKEKCYQDDKGNWHKREQL